MPYRKEALKWRDTEETLRHNPCTCIDGRSPDARHSVAGGSLGLILQVLATIETQSAQNMGADTVLRYLDQFADNVGPVYMHTDQHTAQLIFARMGLPPDTQLTDLKPGKQRSFGELAGLPEHQGCGHLKLLMMHPLAYGIPARLTTTVLKAFFSRYFNGHTGYQFEVLTGSHEEEAAVFIDQHALTAFADQVPLYATDGTATHFFCHRPIKYLLLERYLQALMRTSLPHLPMEMLPAVMTAHNQAAELTLKKLAPDLPVEHISL